MSRTELFSTARPNITKIAILIMDGLATRDVNNTVPEANKTKEQGVEVFTVGITSSVRPSVCLSLESCPWVHFVVVFIAIAAAIYSLGHGLCTFTAVLRSTQPSTLRGTVT